MRKMIGVVAGLALVAGLGRADDPKSLAEVKPITEEQRKAAVAKWREKYDAELVKRLDAYKAAKKAADFSGTAEAKAKAADARDAVTALGKKPFVVMPLLALAPAGEKATTVAGKKGTLVLGGKAPAKAGEVGAFAITSAKVLQIYETGTRILGALPSGSTVIRGNTAATTPGGLEGQDIVIVPAIPGAEVGKRVPVDGLWRTAGVFAVKGEPVAVFQRVEVKADEMPKK